MLSSGVLPRISNRLVRRSQLERWLSTHSKLPVRLIIAPPGSGKTTLLLRYAAASETNVVYFSLPPGATEKNLRGQIAGAFKFKRVPGSMRELIAALEELRPNLYEVVIDDIERMQISDTEALSYLVERAPENISLVFCGRSREAIDVRGWVMRGLAELCDARRMAFDVEETLALAEVCGVAVTTLEARRLVAETDGWAVAIGGTMRTAAGESLSLMDAYVRWIGEYAPLLRDFVTSKLEDAIPEDREALLGLLDGETRIDQGRLRRLESRGLFAINDNGAARLYRPLAHLTPAQGKAVESFAVPPMELRLFRRFGASIDGREIPWVRKRDQQIVKYLLLKASGAASREELASVFWASTDRHLATQSVRTVCSNIRKAIAAVVGYSMVDHYFRTEPQVQLELRNITCDYHRFGAHMSDGDEAFDRGDMDEAERHYRAAEGMYAGRLLDDTIETWAEPYAEVTEERYGRLLERLSQAAESQGKLHDARQWQERGRNSRRRSMARVS